MKYPELLVDLVTENGLHRHVGLSTCLEIRVDSTPDGVCWAIVSFSDDWTVERINMRNVLTWSPLHE